MDPCSDFRPTPVFTLWIIRKELFHFAEMRQAFLISKSHSHLAQARTVLITTIPEEMCNEKELRLWASFVPGGIQNIWIYRDTTVSSPSLSPSQSSLTDGCHLAIKQGASIQARCL